MPSRTTIRELSRETKRSGTVTVRPVPVRLETRRPSRKRTSGRLVVLSTSTRTPAGEGESWMLTFAFAPAKGASSAAAIATATTNTTSRAVRMGLNAMGAHLDLGCGGDD